ncbi:DUF2336 domain-containing protein [Ancylobacter sp. VNQ12]|uniref:DUF2336 domain-containing protein n=1 Tax=Ancylobacter sp. VNQ12 TaxID=3400920 RepID=UPI003BFB3943
MLRALVSLYVREPQHSDAEQSRFATLARRLIDAVEVPVAAKWVREIAPRADMPRELVLHLAQGPLALAGPVLRQSPVLTDEDLVAVARSTSPDHFAAVSARREVSPALAKQLAQLIDQTSAREAEPAPEPAPAIDTEASAPEVAPPPAPPATEPTAEPALARFETALAAMACLPAEAPQDRPVDAAAPSSTIAATPTEAPVEAATDVATSTTANLEAEVPALDEAALELASEATPVEPLPAPVPEYFTASPEERAAMVARLVTLPPVPLAERPAAASDGFTDTLLEAARGGEPGAIAALLEPALGISPENAARVVADGTGQAFAVAARALGLSFAVLSRVLFRLHPATGRSAAEMTRLAETFDMMPVASAQHLVASWRAGRRVPRERAEEAPSMRSYGAPRPTPHASSETAEGRQHG